MTLPSAATRHPFWYAVRVLLRYRCRVGLALFCAVISAACFSLGLGTVMPIMNVLLREEHTLEQLIHQRIGGGPAANGRWLDHVGNALAEIVPGDALLAFVVCIGAFGLLMLAANFTRYLHGLTAITIALRGAMVWRERLFDHLLHTPLLVAQKAGASDGVTRLLLDTNRMAVGFRALLHTGLLELMVAVTALTFAFIINWKLALLATVGAPLIALTSTYFGRRIRSSSARALESITGMLGVASSTFANGDVIKTHGAEGYEQRRFHHLNRQMFRQEMSVRISQALVTPLNEFLSLVGTCAVATLAAWFVLRADASVEEFMTVMALLIAGGSKVKPLTRLHGHLKESEAAAARVLQVMGEPAEPVDHRARRDAPKLAHHQRDIAFESVVFTYPGGDRPAVDGVSLSVTHGQRVAIVGGNGSGKTTLLSMLPRLITPDQGRVLIDGADIANVDLRSLRRQIGMVTQQNVLFEASVADNIAYGRTGAKRERIVEAAKAAYAHEFIETLADGYGTVLGEGGAGLSGGQRQRLCIARAILRDPAILILDEATSQIDTDSEEKIHRAINNFARGRTTFIIAHRLSTVVDADMIVVMDGGRIVDQGRHTELLERSDTYRLLAQSQLHDAKPS